MPKLLAHSTISQISQCDECKKDECQQPKRYKCWIRIEEQGITNEKETNI